MSAEKAGMTNRTLGVLAAAVVAVGAISLWQWTSKPLHHTDGGSQSIPDTAQSVSDTAQPFANSSLAGSVPAQTPKIAVAQTPAKQRRDVWDAPDLLAKARWALVSGTPDEKSWAAEVFRECYAFVDPPDEAIKADLQLLSGDQPDAPDLAMAKKEALQQLEGRCNGVKLMPMSERSALLGELRRGAKPPNEQSMSIHQRVTAIARKVGEGETRFSAAEASALNTSLHGEDPLLRFMAFNALIRAIDDKAAGGNIRREALLYAMGEEITSVPLSRFEAIERCALGFRCPGVEEKRLSSQPDEALLSAEMTRLVQSYREAFAKRQPYDVILAVR